MSGAIINVIHSSSGSGKSTALFMCNSVWGHPVKNASIWKDTFNAKMHRLGVMNNLPNTIDEITNTSPTEFSDLSYSISQGRGKNKMRGSVNEERVNLTSWNGMTLTSSNASFYQKLGAAKDSPDGESMRLLEYEIKPNNLIDVQVGKQMFDHQLRENYGFAGEIYAQWLVNIGQIWKQKIIQQSIYTLQPETLVIKKEIVDIEDNKVYYHQIEPETTYTFYEADYYTFKDDSYKIKE
jgi:uncharacterized protein (DUF927 family)